MARSKGFGALVHKSTTYAVYCAFMSGIDMLNESRKVPEARMYRWAG